MAFHIVAGQRPTGRHRPVRATARTRAAAADTNGAAAKVDGFWLGHPLLECRSSGELARLLTDPVLRGRGVPRGDGRSVLLLPGFLASDATLRLLARFLGRIGYRPVASGIRFNSGCGDSFDERMVGVIDHEYSVGGRRLAIVGHSRGGHYARSLAARYPDRVSHVITMGTGVEDPLDVSVLTKCGVVVVRSALAGCDAARSTRGCLTLRCTCAYGVGFAARFPGDVRFTSIYSRNDGVVRWQSCVADYATCVEVRGSHFGLPFNRHAYRAVAQALAVPATDE
jgi:triacylglycerol lipase